MATHEHANADGPIERRLGPGWRDALDRLIAEQTALFGELDALCDRQRTLVEAGDTDRLAGLLGQRQRVIDRLTATSESFSPFAEAWSLIETSLGDAATRDLRRRVDAVAALAASIAARDEADGRAMRARRDEIADQLAGNTRSRVAANAYAGPRPSGARFQDREA